MGQVNQPGPLLCGRPMSEIFISYSREDAEFARQLATDLTRRGASIWIDVDDIPPGMNWSTAVQEGLDTCDAMILILSPASVKSPDVQDEWQYFMDQKKPLIPVLLEPTTVQFQLNRLQRVDFFSQEYAGAFETLLDRLHIPQIFISYSREDVEFARRLASDLADLGASIWIDIESIRPGENWSTAVQEGLDTCDVMILILSPASMKSSDVRDEWQYFKDQGKVLIPVLWKPTKVHFQLHRLQYVDFTGEDYRIAFRQLCYALQHNRIQLNLNLIGNNVIPIPVDQRSLKPIIPWRRWIIAGMAAVLVAVIVIVAITWSNHNKSGDRVSSTPAIHSPTSTGDLTPTVTHTPSTGTLTPITRTPSVTPTPDFPKTVIKLTLDAYNRTQTAEAASTQRALTPSPP
jgi:hypothetical protein